MKDINILPPAIYNRLAAGEVVENPASIVKELVENSIDAAATKITIQITNGGIDEIVVTDDGEGVTEKNLPKVLLPHATSKIKLAADVERIQSLGFRGEAMSSIAAVAKIEFISKPALQPFAASINQDNETKHVGANNGTTVRVSNLFYNTPARKKFLRSSTIEKNHVTQTVQEIIFANPKLNLRYLVDGKIILDYAGQGMAIAIQKIYGIDPTELLAVKSSSNNYQINGYISNLRLTKINKERQIVVVNGRVINGGLIAAVVNETMANYLPAKEYPVFVLNVKLPPEEVDVNVHPQKREVRFEKKDQLSMFIRRTITETMDKYFLGKIEEIAKPNLAIKEDEIIIRPPKDEVKPIGKSFDSNNTEAQNIFMQSLDLLSENETKVESAPNILNALFVNERKPEPIQVSVLKQYNFKILGQIFETYLLVSTADNLLIIDQHAMAERMNYDKFRAQVDHGEVKSQILLMPIMVKVTPKELNKFETIKPLLSTFGFECDQFGIDTIRITAIPAVMSNMTVNEFVGAVLNDKEITSNHLSEMIKHKIATMACKASIKAGEILSAAQIETFLEQYFNSKNVPLCPHGRPIMLVYSKSKLESLFARK